MSVSHLDAIKKKYGFQTLNVATWRDPKLSVHPARGGPKGPTISPDLVSKPFELTYKVKIKAPPPPEPTDDEDSGGELETEEVESAAPVDAPVKILSPEPVVDLPENIPEISDPEPTQEATDPDTCASETPTESAPAETSPKATISSSLPEDGATGDDTSDTPLETVQSAPVEGSSDQPDLSEPALTGVLSPGDAGDAGDAPAPIDDPLVEGTPQQGSSTEPLQPDLSPDEIVEIVEGTPGSFPTAQEVIEEQLILGEDTSIEIPPPVPEPPTAPVEVLDPNEIITVEEQFNSGEKSPKIVQFAPGTPDPKPTNRKKKMGKGKKGKKKAIVDVSGTGSPDDIVAIEEPPQVVSDPTVEGSSSVADGGTETLQSAEASGESGADPSSVAEEVDLEEPASDDPVPDATVADEQKSDDNTELAMVEEPAPLVVQHEPTVQDKSIKKKGGSKKSKEAPLPPPDPLPVEYSEPIVTEVVPEPAPADFPKERSRDKKKKKSKTKSKEAQSSPPVITIPAGLGIDFCDVLPEEAFSEPLPEASTHDDNTDVVPPSDESAQMGDLQLKQDEIDSTPAEEIQQPPDSEMAPSADQESKLSISVAEDNPAEPKSEGATSDKSNIEVLIEGEQSFEPDVTSGPLPEPSEAVQISTEEASSADTVTMNIQQDGEVAILPDEQEHGEDGARSDSAVDIDSRKGSVDEAQEISLDELDAMDEPLSADELDELDGWDEPLSESESDSESTSGLEVELDPAGDSVDLAAATSDPPLDEEDKKEADITGDAPGEEPTGSDSESLAESTQPTTNAFENEGGSETLQEDPSPEVLNVGEESPEEGESEESKTIDLVEAVTLDEQPTNETEISGPETEGKSNPADEVGNIGPSIESLDEDVTVGEEAFTGGLIDEISTGEGPEETGAPDSEPVEVTGGEDTEAAGETSDGVSDAVIVQDSNQDITQSDVLEDDGGVAGESEPLVEGSSQETAAETPLEDSFVEAVEVMASESAVSESGVEQQPSEDSPSEVVGNVVPESAPAEPGMEEPVQEQTLESLPSTEAEPSPELETVPVDEVASEEPGEQMSGKGDVQEESEIVSPSSGLDAPSTEPVLEPATPEEPSPEPVSADSSIEKEPVVLDTIAIEQTKSDEPGQDAPPSPQFSRSSGSKHKAEHWKRDHKKRGSSDSKKSSEKSRSSRPAKLPEGFRSTRDRSHRSSLLTAEELAAKQRRREERKALEIARIREEESRLAYEEELRRIRHEARRVARKAALEEATRLAKEEAEAVARKEAERRRRHSEVREIDRPRARRENKSTSSGIPKLLGFPLGQSSVRTSINHVKSAFRAGDDERSGTSSSRKEVLRDEVPRTESPTLAGSSRRSKEGGSSSNHRRHRHHRAEGDRPETRRRESERPDTGRSEEKRRRRPAAPEQKPKSFLGRLFA